MAITFAVSDVAPPAVHDALPLVPLAMATKALGAREAVSLSGPQSLVAGPAINALVHSVHTAFATHRPLALAPDVVWLTVLHGVAQHVARNAESLRDRFGAHSGKARVQIRRDDLHPAMDPPGDWSSVPTELCDAVLAYCGATARALRATFSTSSPASQFAMDVALLDALQSYFSYSVLSMCGIPTITLLGTPDDWARIVRQLDALDGLGLEAWLGPLREVLAEFERASRGGVDREFWRALYKPEGFSGGDRVLGWINVLFPYLRDSTACTPRDVARHLPRNIPSPVRYDRTWLTEGELPPKPQEFPLGLARAPFDWRLPANETRAMELVAGLVGAGVDPDTGTVSPQYAWWVAPAVAERAFTVHNPTPEGAMVTPRDPKSVRALHTLGQETAELAGVDMSLSWCAALESLEGLERVRGLTRLALMECNQVESLAPIAGLPAVREVFVSQCKGLRDLSALSTLPTLERVAIMHCPGVTDVHAIRWLAELNDLKSVSLWGFPALPERFRKQLATPEGVRSLQGWLRENG
ncbi:MAG: DUF4419 domain-containing protein [Deltaproteobacteria bacterium]